MLCHWPCGAVGAALLGFGWWGDQAGFWAGKPFITNVFSSVTAVSFGVPLALIVVERMGVAQAEAVEARTARRLAAEVVEDLVLAVPGLRPGAASNLRDAEAGLRVVERAAQEAIRQWEALPPVREARAELLTPPQASSLIRVVIRRCSRRRVSRAWRRGPRSAVHGRSTE